MATKEVGNTGLEVSSGLIDNDYNFDWEDTKRIETALQMRNDGQVAAALRSVKMPIVNLDWFLVTQDEDDPIQQEHLQYVKSVLFEQMNFKKKLIQALTMLDFGFFYFEKLWKIEDGFLVLDRLAPRLQSAHDKWETKDKQAGVTQSIISDQATDSSPSIPAHKLLLFTYDSEGEDPSGIPLIRQAYIHWKIKNLLYKIEVVANERFRAGIPIAHYTDQASKNVLTNFLKNLNSNQQAYGTFQGTKNMNTGAIEENVKFSFITSPESGEAKSSLEMIKHHNRMIAQSVLAQHISLGETSGTQSLGDTFSRDFKLLLSYVTEHIKEPVNQLIKEMIVWRFGKQEDYPKLSHGDIEEKDIKMYMEALKIAIETGTLDVEPKLKKQLRATLKLPVLSEEEEQSIKNEKQEERDESRRQLEPKKEEKEEVKEEAKREVEQVEPNKPKKADKKEEAEGVKKKELNEKVDLQEELELTKWDKHAQKTLNRVLTLAERKVDFDALRKFLNDSESKLAKQLDDLTQQQKDLFFSKLEKSLKDEDIKAINEQQTQLSNKIKKVIKEASIEALAFGKANGASEIKVKEPSTPSVFTQAINGEVDDLVKNRNQQLSQEVKSSLRESTMKGVGALAAITTAKVLFDKKSKRLNQSIVGFVSAQNLNRGRQVVFDANIDKAYAIMRSEILDSSTCNFCISIDGRVMEPTDPFAKLGAVHENCDGIQVVILKTETPPPKITGVPKSIKSRIETVEGVPSTNAFKQLKNPIIRKDSRAFEKKGFSATLRKRF